MNFEMGFWLSVEGVGGKGDEGEVAWHVLALL